ncbi:DUF7309 domain-containing protein [Planococcus sp. YIM B11945]|uniref:DUF7309 domain-containing protein n=1 Tax=Planococcus sp. YIM B11945 TaxID=3435410 RepID=UPI003D7ECFE7
MENEERLFISVLGGAGQEFGLAIYIGNEGLNSLRLAMEQKTPLQDIVFQQRSILMSFVDRDELESEDYMFLKAHGIPFRGKKQWPEFRSMVPGSYPWSIDEEEARYIIMAIEQTLSVLGMVERGTEIPAFGLDNQILIRAAKKTAQGHVWETEMMPKETFFQEKTLPLEIPQIVPDLVVKQASKHPIMDSQIEFDLFYVDMPIQPSAGARPYFPYMAVALDHKTGMVLNQELFENRNAFENAQFGLNELVNRISMLPKELWLREEMFQMLKAILTKLKVKAKKVENLPEAERFKEFLSQIH